MSPDGVYMFNVAYDPETGEGGYSVTLRAEEVECLCPALQHGGNASPPWTDVLQFALDSGAVCEYIPPITGPADTVDITAIRGDVYA